MDKTYDSTGRVRFAAPAGEHDLREMAEKLAGEPDLTRSTACRAATHRHCRVQPCACPCHSSQDAA